ncbi:TPA: macrocin O-methyltransferase [bacterium]|nr:macrocin O-methyltransferase [bacterium]
MKTLELLDIRNVLTLGVQHIEGEFIEIYEKCRDYTMTSVERMYSLYKAIKYVVRYRVYGDMVECGVWKGGSSMMMALTLIRMNEIGRKIYLYDTYRGMSAPTDEDVDYRSRPAKEEWLSMQGKDFNKWSYASLGLVKANMLSTGYPHKNIIFVKGKVEKTIPSVIPERIAILRLDTDWYESTYHELTHLFPRLSMGGVLIIDDYGYWKGAKKTTDKYFTENEIKISLEKIDFTGRIAIKV